MTFVRLAALLLIVLLPSRAAAQPLAIDGIEIVEFGLYATRVEQKVSDADAPVGHLNMVSGHRLLETGDEFCAKLNLEFGVKYRVLGKAVGKPATLDMVTVFPPSGMTNAAGKRFAKSGFKQAVIIGDTSARTYSFEEPWEMVPGVWTFEFHYLGRKLGEKQFKILPSCPIS